MCLGAGPRSWRAAGCAAVDCARPTDSASAAAKPSAARPSRVFTADSLPRCSGHADHRSASTLRAAKLPARPTLIPDAPRGPAVEVAASARRAYTTEEISARFHPETSPHRLQRLALRRHIDVLTGGIRSQCHLASPGRRPRRHATRWTPAGLAWGTLADRRPVRVHGAGSFPPVSPASTRRSAWFGQTTSSRASGRPCPRTRSSSRRRSCRWRSCRAATASASTSSRFIVRPLASICSIVRRISDQRAR
jgi:hypothetical protein